MSSIKKTITIPATVGSSNLSEVFGKISFSTEVKDLLSALAAEISIRYNPGAEKPIISVLSSTGNPVCSLDEFKALSGYRRFVSDAIKEVDKATSSSAKTKIVAYFLREAPVSGVVAPARILEQNQTKFNQNGSSIEMLNKHLEVISTTIDNEWKDYLTNNGMRIMRILLSLQLQCMGPEIVGKEYLEEELFEAGVPKWLYSKFIDKNFTNNLKTDSVNLLFPKNNYLKAIALSTQELNCESFLTANKIVVAKSGGIITLAKANFSGLFPTYSADMREQVEMFLEKYQWILTNPAKADELLSIRETGKAPPVFRELQAPKKIGQEQRPESEVARICRAIGNILGKIQSTWNGIMNFVIPVANPRTEFWIEVFATAKNWEITPTNSIYNCIRNENAALAVLDNVRSCKSVELLVLIANIVAQTLLVPHGTGDCKSIIDVFKTIENRSEFVKKEEFLDEIVINHRIANLGAMETTPVTEVEITTAKTFLGIQVGKLRTTKRSGAGAVRLDTRVLNELKPFVDKPLYDPIVNWLMTTFKTNNRRALQLIAAERILGEALKHQETIFGEDFDETDELLEIEGYYEDDN